MQNIAIIRNPTAHRTGLLRQWLHLRESITAACPSVRIFETQHRGHATDLAVAAAQGGADLIVACGGDGTISEVVNGMYGSQAKLAIFPLGSGNDLARLFGVTQENCVDTAMNGRPQSIDVGEWRSSDSKGYFVNIAGCGFDAVVATRIGEGFGPLRGTAAYIAAVLETLMRFKPAEAELVVDGVKSSCTIMLCAVANSQYYGGGMRIAPHADPSDGILDMVVVQRTGRLDFLATFPKVFKGTHLTHRRVFEKRGRVISVESHPALSVLADGEIVGTTPVSFSLAPVGIQVMVPKGSD